MIGSFEDYPRRLRNRAKALWSKIPIYSNDRAIKLVAQIHTLNKIADEVEKMLK